MSDPVYVHIENFCCIEKALVSLRNQGMVLITGDNQDTDAADNNGAGKSTIPKALTWCLFGETLDGDKLDEVIRWGTKRAEVATLLIKGAEHWIVRRWREKGKPGLELSFVKSKKRGRSKDIAEEPWEGSPKEVQAKVIELVGRDFRAFCNTSLFGQGDVNRFFSATDQVMKDTLHRIMRSDIYRRGELKLREREVKQTNAAITEAESTAELVESRIEESNLEALEGSHFKWEEGRDERADAALAEATRLIVKTKVVSANVKVKRGELRRDIGELQSELKDAEKLKGKLDKLRADSTALLKAQADADKQYVELGLEVDGIDEALSHLRGDKCDRCTAPLTKGAPAKYIKELAGRRERLAEQREGSLKWVNAATAKVEENSSEVRKVRADLSDIDALPEDLADVKAELSELDAKVAEEKATLKALAKAQLARVQEARDEENPHASRLEVARTRVAELNTELDGLLATLKEKRNDLAHYSFWVRGFGPQGLPSLLLDSTMPYLTERANEHLQILTDGDISVEFDTQRELKSRKGELKDEISKECVVEGVPGATPSKGQTRKLEVSSDLALLDLAETTESSSPLLFMDEVLDGLDAEGSSRMLRLLKSLRGKRTSIFVVTHEIGLAQSFEKVLHVTKKDKASTIAEVK